MNPQSIKPSVAMGPVPSAPKPAPTPIMSNMPQFGANSGVVNSQGIPTLPRVGTTVAEPVSPAPTTPAPAPIQPALSSPAVPQPQSSQNSRHSMRSHRLLNVIFAGLTAIFTTLAIIFAVLWQQVPKTETVYVPASIPPATPIQLQLSCLENANLTEENLASGVISGDTIREIIYLDDELDHLRIIFDAYYENPELASAAFEHVQSETYENLKARFAEVDIDTSSSTIQLEDNLIRLIFDINASDLFNPANLESRAALLGLSNNLLFQEDSVYLNADLESVQNTFTSQAMTCDVVEE